MDFWRAMLRLAFGVFVGESVAVGVYVFDSPGGPNRAALATMSVASALSASSGFLIAPWIAHQRWREQFSLIWTLIAGGALTAAVCLDGGLGSPLLFLLLLPVTYAGLVFRPVAAAGCAIVSLAELLTVTLTTTGTIPTGTFLMVASVTAGLGLLTWLSSLHRARLDRRFAVLAHDLEVLAATDFLTGCLNHRAFNQRLVDEVDRALRYRSSLSLVVADVDDFKRVNDTYGHLAGDTALQLAGSTLRERSRRSDVVGRIGGDEFALLLPGAALEAAAGFARRVFEPCGTGADRLTFSAGVATLDSLEPTADHLFRDADRALYQVKRTRDRGIAVATL